MPNTIDDFNRDRAEMNERILDSGHLGIKRFFALDHQAYEGGALEPKVKELLGLVASLVLRCDDCITYHVLQCVERGVRREEFLDAFVYEPQPGLHGDDGLADNGEPKVPRFDESGVHRADGYLVDAGPFDLDERERITGLVDRRGRAGVAARSVRATAASAIRRARSAPVHGQVTIQ